MVASRRRCWHLRRSRKSRRHAACAFTTWQSWWPVCNSGRRCWSHWTSHSTRPSWPTWRSRVSPATSMTTPTLPGGTTSQWDLVLCDRVFNGCETFMFNTLQAFLIIWSGSLKVGSHVLIAFKHTPRPNYSGDDRISFALKTSDFSLPLILDARFKFGSSELVWQFNLIPSSYTFKLQSVVMYGCYCVGNSLCRSIGLNLEYNVQSYSVRT